MWPFCRHPQTSANLLFGFSRRQIRTTVFATFLFKFLGLSTCRRRGQEIQCVYNRKIEEVLPPFENDNPIASHLKYDKLFKNFIGRKNYLRTQLFNGVWLVALRLHLHGEIHSFWETSQGKNGTSVNLGKKIFFCELIFCQRGEKVCLLFQFLQNFWLILFCEMNIFLLKCNLY